MIYEYYVCMKCDCSIFYHYPEKTAHVVDGTALAFTDPAFMTRNGYIDHAVTHSPSP